MRTPIDQQEARHAALSARLHTLTASERGEYDRLDNARDCRRRRLDHQLASARARVQRLEFRKMLYEGY